MLMITTGCSGADGELLSRAKSIHEDMRDEVAAFQLNVFDGAWLVSGYGGVPEQCGLDGYRFSFMRSTPLEDGWRLPHGTIRQNADDLMKWLEENGWSGIILRTYTEGVSSVTIEAEKTSAHVEDLLVTISSGTAHDIVDVRVTGTCEPGSQKELRELIFPEGTSGLTPPESEYPTAVPEFGLGARDSGPTASPTASPAS